MEKNLSTFIYILHEAKSPLSDEECARIMNVSKRTIRNYVEILNKDKAIIQKLNNGYKLKDPSLIYIPGTYKLSDTPMERRKKILIKLLNEYSDVEKDYLDAFYISQSTLNADISYLKTKVSPYDVQINTHHNKIILNGSEYEKRKIIALMVSFEDFNPDPTNRYAQIIHKAILEIENKGFSINHFTKMYLTNHLCIQLLRIEQGYQLSDIGFEHNNLQIYEFALIIKETFESLLSVQLSDHEFIYIQEILLAVNLQNFDYESDDLDRFFLEAVQLVVSQINMCYDYNIDYHNFKNYFLQHVKNLYFRSIHHIEIDNPLSIITKNEYPLVHDVAVFAASILEECLNININESEISFISFHLGAYLTKQTTNKINFAFIYQSYHPYYKNLIRSLMKYFDQLSLIHI